MENIQASLLVVPLKKGIKWDFSISERHAGERLFLSELVIAHSRDRGISMQITTTIKKGKASLKNILALIFGTLAKDSEKNSLTISLSTLVVGSKAAIRKSSLPVYQSVISSHLQVNV